jgi:hypothetical protein
VLFHPLRATILLGRRRGLGREAIVAQGIGER